MSTPWKCLMLGSICAAAYLLAGCATSGLRLSDVQETDLTGVWQAEYIEVHSVDYATGRIIHVTGVETLALSADGTYKQIYDDGHGYMYESEWQPWHLDSEKLVHLLGGRWYPSGAANAEQYAEDGGIWTTLRGNRIHVDFAKEILLVANVEGNGDIILQHLPAFAPDSSPVTFRRLTQVTSDFDATTSPQ